jgi:predicted  nucleic acid-binding Zn-ribbon protein
LVPGSSPGGPTNSLEELVNNVIKLLMELQEMDSRILQKRVFVDKVPQRIHEVDEPLKLARQELDKIRQKSEGLAGKRREKEKILDELNEKIGKMKSRVSDIKTNKEYQAHLKEIESFEKEVSGIEEEVLVIMEDLDSVVKEQQEKEERVNEEVERINAFKTELDREVERYEKELSSLKEQRAAVVNSLPAEVYSRYMSLISSGNGVAVTEARNEICLGCNMNIPPQLFVEIRKNEELIQCPQCRRILYYSEE